MSRIFRQAGVPTQAFFVRCEVLEHSKRLVLDPDQSPFVQAQIGGFELLIRAEILEIPHHDSSNLLTFDRDSSLKLRVDGLCRIQNARFDVRQFFTEAT